MTGREKRPPASLASDASHKNHYALTRARAHVGHNGENLTQVTHLTQADELDTIAGMVRRLLPDRRDPEAFHVAKAEAADRIRQIARKIRAENPGKGGG